MRKLKIRKLSKITGVCCICKRHFFFFPKGGEKKALQLASFSAVVPMTKAVAHINLCYLEYTCKNFLTCAALSSCIRSKI